MTYSHSYEDPDTGEIVDVYDDDADYRNAGTREARGSRVGRFILSRRDRHDFGGRRPGHRDPRPRPRSDGHRPGPRPGIVREDERRLGPPAVDDGEYFAINKRVFADIVPAVGKVWASLLGAPEGPQATGDDIVDRDNATLHRQALAAHQQNQTRILALTDLAARAIKLFV